MRRYVSRAQVVDWRQASSAVDPGPTGTMVRAHFRIIARNRVRVWSRYGSVGAVAIIDAGGIASAEAFGTPTVTYSELAAITGAGAIASGESFGLPSISANGYAAISAVGGIASAEVFGVATVNASFPGLGSIVNVGDIASAEAFGVPSVAGNGRVVAAIPSSRAFDPRWPQRPPQ